MLGDVGLSLRCRWRESLSALWRHLVYRLFQAAAGAGAAAVLRPVTLLAALFFFPFGLIDPL